jgi:Lon protease-like protein
MFSSFCVWQWRIKHSAYKLESMSKKGKAEDSEFDETIEEAEEIESYLEQVRHITELALYPQELVILPYETMTLQVSDKRAQRLLEDAKNDVVNLGIVEQAAGEKAMPPIGSIGVGANVEEIDKSLGKTHLVNIRGYIRFRIDEYIDTDKPYPVARITFFEDDEITDQLEKLMCSDLFVELHELTREFNRLVIKQKHPGNFAEMMKEKHLRAYSFLMWRLFAPLPQALRKMLLEMHLTDQRTYVLNQHLKRTLEKIKNQPPASFN